jgi:hypothetical protein
MRVDVRKALFLILKSLDDTKTSNLITNRRKYDE